MIGNIHENLKLRRTRILLCKPDRTAIAELSDHYNLTYNQRLGQLNELTFNLPYEAEIHQVLQKVRYIDEIKERYLLRFEILMPTPMQRDQYQDDDRVYYEENVVHKEWFVINNIKDNAETNHDNKEIHGFSLAYELQDKILTDFKKTGTATELLEAALEEVTGISISSGVPADYLKEVWTVDVDSEFDVTTTDEFGEQTDEERRNGRTVDVSKKTYLEFLFEICQKYNAIAVFDTENRVVKVEKPENVGHNLADENGRTKPRLAISYGQYLKKANQESTTDEMVTRLKPTGNDKIGIQSVVPTGSPFLEDYSYFIFPYQKDESGNVIAESYYMSNDLCEALLAYQEKSRNYETAFRDLRTRVSALEKEKSDIRTEATKIKAKYDAAVTGNNTYRSLQQVWYASNENQTYTYTNAEGVEVTEPTNIPTSIQASTLKTDNPYVVFVKQNGEWIYLERFKGRSSYSFSTDGTNTQVFLTKMEPYDYEHGLNENVLEKYCEYVHLARYQAQQALYQAKDDAVIAITGNGKAADEEGYIQGEMGVIRDDLDLYTNFTPEQLIERNRFAIQREWSDDTIDDPLRLYEQAIKKFEELRTPTTTLSIDIIDFLEIVSERHNWQNLTIGDTIIVQYERLNMDIRAKVVQIDQDFESGSIKLQITNVQDMAGVNNDWLKMLYGSISSSATLDSKKFEWNKVEAQGGRINALIENFWSEIGQYIATGSNNSVEISNRGILITEPTMPTRMLIANNGVLAITDDGGNTWKNAITWKGIVGEQIFGKQILGVNLTIEHDGGIFSVDANGVTIDGQALTITGGGISHDMIDFGETFYDDLSSRIEGKFTSLIGTIDLSEALAEELEGMVYQDVDYNGIQISSDFGLRLTGFMGQKTPVTRMALSGDRGMELFRNLDYKTGQQNWEKTFWLDYNGTLMTKNMKTKNLMIEDDNGFFLLQGNYMQVRDQQARTIVEFGYLQNDNDFGLKIFSDYNRLYVTKNDTFRLTDSTGENLFWVERNGDLWARNIYCKKLTILREDGEEILKDNILDLTMFDKVVMTNIDAHTLMTDRLTARDGYISNLTVNKVVTNDYVTHGDGGNDYIKIEEHVAKWITGRFLGHEEVQETSPLGDPLYYTDEEEDYLTIEPTAFPVFRERWEERAKLQIYFREVEEARVPVMEFGEGALEQTTGLEKKGFLVKETNGFHMKYFNETSERRAVEINDQSIRIEMTQGSETTGYAGIKKILYMTEQEIILNITDSSGQIRTGSYLSLTPTGITVKTDGAVSFLVAE